MRWTNLYIREVLKEREPGGDNEINVAGSANLQHVVRGKLF